MQKMGAAVNTVTNGVVGRRTVLRTSPQSLVGFLQRQGVGMLVSAPTIGDNPGKGITYRQKYGSKILYNSTQSRNVVRSMLSIGTSTRYLRVERCR